VVTKEN